MNTQLEEMNSIQKQKTNERRAKDEKKEREPNTEKNNNNNNNQTAKPVARSMWPKRIMKSISFDISLQ